MKCPLCLLLTCMCLYAGRDQSCAQLRATFQEGTALTATAIRDSLLSLVSRTDTTGRAGAAVHLYRATQRLGRIPVEDSLALFMYCGAGTHVTVPGDMNGWNPPADSMQHISGSPVFFLARTYDPRARLEYKIKVDEEWLLDPLNPQRIEGGYGFNSELRMPLYRPPAEAVFRPEVSHGKIDTVRIALTTTGNVATVYIYTPPGALKEHLPVIFVLDGGEYLSLAKMNVIMDNMIADRRIPPLLGVFIDPRTDPRDSRTSTRMKDYGVREEFLADIIDVIRPQLAQSYHFAHEPSSTAIMGVSLGGLMATYAGLVRADIFGIAAAQSPSYQYLRDSIFTIAGRAAPSHVSHYIDTGTYHDTRERALRMATLLKDKAGAVKYQEFPEGHNWGNWMSHIDDILEFAFKHLNK